MVPTASRCWAETWGIGVPQVRMRVGQEVAPPAGVVGVPCSLTGSPPCSWQPIMKFINDQYEKYLQEEVNINRKKRIPDTRVHCCLYFIPATGHSYVPQCALAARPQPECPDLPLASTLRPTHLSTIRPAREDGGPLAGWAQGGPEPGLCLLRAGVLAGLAGGQRLSSCVSLALTCPSVRVASP